MIWKKQTNSECGTVYKHLAWTVRKKESNKGMAGKGEGKNKGGKAMSFKKKEGTVLD